MRTWALAAMFSLGLTLSKQESRRNRVSTISFSNRRTVKAWDKGHNVSGSRFHFSMEQGSHISTSGARVGIRSPGHRVNDFCRVLSPLWGYELTGQYVRPGIWSGFSLNSLRVPCSIVCSKRMKHFCHVNLDMHSNYETYSFHNTRRPTLNTYRHCWIAGVGCSEAQSAAL